MTVFDWSQTAANNASADPTINYKEGQAPSTLNDSARGQMAAVAKWRDDLSGKLITAGIATAYTLTSNQNLANVPTGSTPANVDGFEISFKPHIANGAAATLSVDGQTARPLQSAAGGALTANFFALKGIYTATYSVTDLAWIVQTSGFSLATNNTWTGANAFAASGLVPVTVNRTENDTTLRKAISIQSGSGAGNDYSINETGDGSNGVVTVTEQIGATVIGTKTAAAYGFPIPQELTEIATPAAPAAGKLRLYGKTGDALAVQGSNGVERIIGLALPGAHFLTIKNNAGTPNSQADVTILGQVICTNSSGFAVQFNAPGTITCNLAVAGLNGLDAGSLAAAIQPVYFYGVSNGTLFKILASLTAPTAGGPSLANAAGYTFNCYLGSMITDTTPNLKGTIQTGDRVTYTGTPPTITSSAAAQNVAPSFPTTCKAFFVSISGATTSDGAVSDFFGRTIGLIGGLNGGNGGVLIAEVHNLGATFTANSVAAGATFTAYGWRDRVNAT